MEVSTAKAISMLALGLGSFVASMAPAFISEESRRRHPLLISSLLCFGAGVLLSTSLLHMLPEARENLPEYSELLLCAGFFLVYIVDEIVHFFNGAKEHGGHVNYGSGETSGLLRNVEGLDGEMRQRCCGDAGNPRMCHVSHTEPCNKSSSGLVGLLAALFVHSVLEGLAIGLQQSASKVMLLLGAVASHKYVVGFCLGAEVCASARLCAQLVCALLFSGGSVAGIAAGAVLDNVQQLTNSVAVPVMQALAAGTLLYVTVSEVLPRERARWHERRRGAGAMQLAAVGVGFVLMYLMMRYLGHEEA